MLNARDAYGRTPLMVAAMGGATRWWRGCCSWGRTLMRGMRVVGQQHIMPALRIRPRRWPCCWVRGLPSTRA